MMMIWLILYLIGVFATMVLCASIEIEESNFRVVLVSVVWPLLLVYFAMTLIKDHYERKKNMGEVSDGYHTFNELYEYRLLYNAAFLMNSQGEVPAMSINPRNIRMERFLSEILIGSS